MVATRSQVPATTPAPLQVVLVEPTPTLEERLRAEVEQWGCRVSVHRSVRAALDAVRAGEGDVVVVDLRVGDLDWHALRAACDEPVRHPVIGIADSPDPAAVAAALDAGADDVVRTACAAPVLHARMRALLRRMPPRLPPRHRIVVGAIEVDTASQVARLRGQEVGLTPTLFALLVELARHAGEAVSRRELLARVWGCEYLGQSRLIDMAVARLRERLGDDPSCPRFIETVRNAGYRLVSGRS